jgi:hypothetical protein
MVSSDQTQHCTHVVLRAQGSGLLIWLASARVYFVGTLLGLGRCRYLPAVYVVLNRVQGAGMSRAHRIVVV